MKPENLPQSDTPDPAQRELSRRSGSPTISLWLVIGAILLLGAAVYAASALF